MPIPYHDYYVSFPMSTFGTSPRGGSKSAHWECHLILFVSSVSTNHTTTTKWHSQCPLLEPPGWTWGVLLNIRGMVCVSTDDTKSTQWQSQGPLLEPPTLGCHLVVKAWFVYLQAIQRVLSGIPKVHFWNLPAGRFQKWTLGMPLTSRGAVCVSTDDTKTTKWHAQGPLLEPPREVPKVNLGSAAK